jgi:hypothetical protein
MKIFLLKCLGLVSIMFISVLVGMQMANDGIHKMKDKTAVDFQNAVTINKKDHQVISKGNDSTSHNLESKKKQLEEINAFNFFSMMGKTMSDGITKSSEELIKKIIP